MTTINHECYVSLEVAKLLKEAGFDWNINSCYNCYGIPILSTDMGVYKNYNENENIISAPTLEVTQRWLREVKRAFVTVSIYGVKEQELTDTDKFSVYIEKWDKKERWKELAEIDDFNTYELAQEAGIKKALEMLLEKGE